MRASERETFGEYRRHGMAEAIRGTAAHQTKPKGKWCSELNI